MAEEQVKDPQPTSLHQKASTAGRRIKGLKTRQRIVEAASRHLLITGVDGFSVPELALDVGISEGAVYYHFPTRQAVLVAGADFLAHEDDAAVVRIISQATDGVSAAVAIVRTRLYQHWRQPQRAWLTSVWLPAQDLGDHEGRAKIYQEWVEGLTGLLRQSDSTMAQDEAEILANGVLLAASGIVREGMFRGLADEGAAIELTEVARVFVSRLLGNR